MIGQLGYILWGSAPQPPCCGTPFVAISSNERVSVRQPSSKASPRIGVQNSRASCSLKEKLFCGVDRNHDVMGRVHVLGPNAPTTEYQEPTIVCVTRATLTLNMCKMAACSPGQRQREKPSRSFGTCVDRLSTIPILFGEWLLEVHL